MLKLMLGLICFVFFGQAFCFDFYCPAYVICDHQKNECTSDSPYFHFSTGSSRPIVTDTYKFKMAQASLDGKWGICIYSTGYYQQYNVTFPSNSLVNMDKSIKNGWDEGGVCVPYGDPNICPFRYDTTIK